MGAHLIIPTISEDLFLEILLRLPVKSICRSSSVCKTWNLLINSAFFINLQHSTISSSTPANLKPRIGAKIGNAGDYIQGSYAIHYPQENTRVENLRFPFQFLEDQNDDFFTHVDVINGIVCVSYSSNVSFDSTILWNPAINKYINLPRLPVDTPAESPEYSFANFIYYSASIGFGYDASKNDFKVVRIWMANWNMKSFYNTKSSTPIPIPTTYQVYSTRDGVYRNMTANDIPCCISDYSMGRVGCFVNGTIHWLVKSYDLGKAWLLMFDCELEEMRRMELPEVFNSNNTNESCQPLLLAYDGKLSALIQWNRFEHVEIWAMEENEWKKLFRVETNCHNYPLMDNFMKQFISSSFLRYRQLWKNHVYEESLFFMDHHKAKSYKNQDSVICHYRNIWFD